MHKNTIKITMEMIDDKGSKLVLETAPLNVNSSILNNADYEFSYGIKTASYINDEPIRFNGSQWSRAVEKYFELSVKLPTTDAGGIIFMQTEYPAPTNQLVMVLLDDGKVVPVDDEVDNVGVGALKHLLEDYIYFVVDLPD